MAQTSSTASLWIQGARPNTWANAFAPVIAGSAAAASMGMLNGILALLAAIVAWALIIGVNYANDYSDGIRGTDNDRTGPTRLTASGLVPPKQVRNVAFFAFAVAGIAGIILSLLTHWWLILIGIVCILAAWFYTGGKNPYGYKGFGEIAVFIFFGLVGVLGTQFTQADTIDWVGVVLALGIGGLSSSVNLANNLRDIPTDTQSGKITLAVRLGDESTRHVWVMLVLLPLLVTILLSVYSPWLLLGLLAGIPLYFAARPIVTNAKGKDLIPVLKITGITMIIWATINLAVMLVLNYF